MTRFLPSGSPRAPSGQLAQASQAIPSKSVRPQTGITRRTQTAVVYCEANFGAIDGKTANGLVRYSEKHKLVAVIDSDKTGLDSGVVLGDRANNIPI